MSRDLLEKILTNKTKYNSNELISFLLLFKKGSFIYPSTIKRKFNIEDKEVYNILSILEEEKILKMYYEIFCGQCFKSLKLCEYYSQLNEIIYCEDCEEEECVKVINNVKIVYKVVK